MCTTKPGGALLRPSPLPPLPSGALLRSATAPAPGGSFARAAAPYRRPPWTLPVSGRQRNGDDGRRRRSGRREESAGPRAVIPPRFPQNRSPGKYQGGFTRVWFCSFINRDDAPKLLAALKEMKDGLDLVRSKVESLTRKVPPLSPLAGSPSRAMIVMITPVFSRRNLDVILVKLLGVLFRKNLNVGIWLIPLPNISLQTWKPVSRQEEGATGLEKKNYSI